MHSQPLQLQKEKSPCVPAARSTLSLNLEIALGGEQLEHSTLMGGKRILVVDDQEMVLLSIKLTLSSIGYSIDTAGSGSEALHKLDSGEFDLVLTDWKMADITGDKLAREIKTKTPRMPVILMSGFPPTTAQPDIDGVLLKPFSAEELRKTVASFRAD
jgi:CheY-like chemotaxis protein